MTERSALDLFRIAAVLSFVALLLASGDTTPARGLDKSALIDGSLEDCTQIPPEKIVTPSLSITPMLPIEVRVLAEAGDLDRAKALMRGAITAYRRIGVDIRDTYDVVRVPAAWKKPTGISPDRSPEELFDLIKGRYGGSRPRKVDVVYYFTRYWGGGLADCIGGVRFPDRAFAFGSIDYKVEGVIPVPTVDEGVIAAHEIGHLFGAHHHYANCVEAAPKGAQEGVAGVCTTMAPAAAAASPFFGVMEQTFIRYFAETYSG